MRVENLVDDIKADFSGIKESLSLVYDTVPLGSDISKTMSDFAEGASEAMMVSAMPFFNLSSVIRFIM